jgi:hypothetical protein
MTPPPATARRGLTAAHQLRQIVLTRPRFPNPRVGVAPASVFRVLDRHGRALPHRRAREPQTRTLCPAWVS